MGWWYHAPIRMHRDRQNYIDWWCVSIDKGPCQNIYAYPVIRYLNRYLFGTESPGTWVHVRNLVIVLPWSVDRQVYVGAMIPTLFDADSVPRLSRDQPQDASRQQGCVLIRGPKSLAEIQVISCLRLEISQHFGDETKPKVTHFEVSMSPPEGLAPWSTDGMAPWQLETDPASSTA